MATPQYHDTNQTMINQDTDSYPGYASEDHDSPHTNSSGEAVSCEKSMNDASPEPLSTIIPSNNGGNKDQSYYTDRKTEKMKKIQNFLIAALVAMTVACIGVLVGLVILATGKKTPSLDIASPEGTDHALTPVAPKDIHVSDPKKSYGFPHFSGNDPDIAIAFADHSLYTTFYGVSYAGPADISNFSDRKGPSDDLSGSLQRQITLDVALMSRVSPRVRLNSLENRLADRVIQAISDLNTNIDLTLSVDPQHGYVDTDEVRRIMNSYPHHYVKTILIEKSVNASEAEVYTAFDVLHKFLIRKDLQDEVQLKVVTAQAEQANPMTISVDHPRLAIDYVNSNLLDSAYTNLETPSETSEKAFYMTSWVCGVAPNLRDNIEWFWANSFDNSAMNITNGIFQENRKLKPAGLPRCQDYKIPRS